MSKKKKSGVRQKVLSDHKKIGSKLVPLWPLLFPSEDVRWSGNIIPELLWLGLLNEQYGWQREHALRREEPGKREHERRRHGHQCALEHDEHEQAWITEALDDVLEELRDFLHAGHPRKT